MRTVKVHGPVYIYVNANEGRSIKYSQMIGKNVFADYDKDDELVGIEILTDIGIENSKEI